MQDGIQLHGFGGWAYGHTDGNRYQIGQEDGSYNNSYFALNISASPYERFSANVQTLWRTSDEGLEVEFDYAFAEWEFFDWLKLRIGKVKCPFGIYTEVYDVGTLRPFYSLPQSIYGLPGQVLESYYGLGLTGLYYFPRWWGVQYDLYFGELLYKKYAMQGFQSLSDAMIEPVVRNSAGTRVVVHTPLEGLNVGFSLRQGETEIYVGEEIMQMAVRSSEGRYLNYTFRAEYLNNEISVRAEYAGSKKLDEGEEIGLFGYYLEGAYLFRDHYQVALLYDAYGITYPDSVIAVVTMPEDHRETAVGFNYWFNPNLVLKLSYHYVKGNVFAAPDDMIEILITGRDPEEITQMVIFGTQFSF